MICVCKVYKIIANIYWAIYIPVLDILHVKTCVILSATIWGNAKGSAHSESQLQNYTRPASLLTPIASSGVLETILRFKNPLEGLTELTECCYAPAYVYYRKRIQIKSAKGMGTEQSPGRIHTWNFQLNSVNSSWWGCATLCTEYSQPGKLTWALGVQSFTGAPSHTACMADLQSPVLPGGRTATTWPKALIIKSHS